MGNIHEKSQFDNEEHLNSHEPTTTASVAPLTSTSNSPSPSSAYVSVVDAEIGAKSEQHEFTSDETESSGEVSEDDTEISKNSDVPETYTFNGSNETSAEIPTVIELPRNEPKNSYFWTEEFWNVEESGDSAKWKSLMDNFTTTAGMVVMCRKFFTFLRACFPKITLIKPCLVRR